MINTKYNICTHILIRYLPDKLYNIVTGILICNRPVHSYDIIYTSNGDNIEIKYEGEPFGLKELECEVTKQHENERKYRGGNGSKVILGGERISYKYDGAHNIWLVRVHAGEFKHIRNIPRQIVDFELSKHIDGRKEYNCIDEIALNAIAHNRIIYENNVTLYIIRNIVIIVRYLLKYHTSLGRL